MNGLKDTHKRLQAVLAFALLISVCLLCGQGRADSGAITLQGKGMVTGDLVKGPISNGTVVAYAIRNGQKDTRLARGATDKRGNFSISISNYSGPVLLQLFGGTFTEETSGSTMPMFVDDVMSVLIPSASMGSKTISGIIITQFNLRDTPRYAKVM